MINCVGITRIKTLDLDPDTDKDKSSLISYHLKWRNKILFVNSNGNAQPLEILALKSEWWLVNCLQKSLVKQICLAPQLGLVGIKNWATVGKKANKKVFLRTSPDLSLFLLQNTLSWGIKRTVDSIMALLLLFLFSPLILVIMLRQKLSGNTVFVRQWCVGKQGLLFQTIKFATNSSCSTFLNRVWSSGLSRLGLHNLPQLINILRGEMSFVGRYPYDLDEALALNVKQRKVLKIVPGIMGMRGRGTLKQDLGTISLLDREYLSLWSLVVDLKILLLSPFLIFLGKNISKKNYLVSTKYN